MGATGPTDPRSFLGQTGEDAALAVYRRMGFRLVARNWRCPAGELDLILHREGLLVFCEVKSRSGSAFGGGYEAVTWQKRRKLRQLAELFLRVLRTSPQQVRFDVASVLVRGKGPPEVELFQDAF